MVVCKDLEHSVQVKILLQFSHKDREELNYKDVAQFGKIKVSIFMMVLHVELMHGNELLPLESEVLYPPLVIIFKATNGLERSELHLV